VIPLLALFGMFFFCFAAFDCTLTISRSAYAEIYIGYWYRESTGFALSNGEESDGNICKSWSDGGVFDGLWKFGKAVGVLGAFTTIFTMLFDLLLLYRRLEEKWFAPLIVIHFGNALMCSFLLGGLASEVCKNELCEMARGSVNAIIGALIWIAAAICIMCLRRKEKILYEEEEAPPDEEFLALPAAERKKRNNLALPSTEEPREPEPEFLALPAAQELESDSDDENEVYNEDLKRLPASEKKKKKKKKSMKALPDSENTAKKKKKKKSKS